MRLESLPISTTDLYSHSDPLDMTITQHKVVHIQDKTLGEPTSILWTLEGAVDSEDDHELDGEFDQTADKIHAEDDFDELDGFMNTPFKMVGELIENDTFDLARIQFEEQVDQDQTYPTTDAQELDDDIENDKSEHNVDSDTDVSPSLPIIQVLFEQTLHELFYPSSAAFKNSRPIPPSWTSGELLFETDDQLIRKPLSMLFEHLRQDLITLCYGADGASRFELCMVFKGLDDLWLGEHEPAASTHSLLKLIHLYMASSGMQGQEEMLLEPFHIELKIQESFLAHLHRIESGLLPHGATISLEVDEAVENDTDLLASVEQPEYDETFVQSNSHQTSSTQKDNMLTDDFSSENDVSTEALLEGLDEELDSSLETYEIAPADEELVSSGYDHTAHVAVLGDADAEDRIRDALKEDIAALEHGSQTHSTRAPKRPASELEIDVLTDDLVDSDFSPDRDFKKAKAVI